MSRTSEKIASVDDAKRDLTFSVLLILLALCPLLLLVTVSPCCQAML
jgi:hypothetical protein